MISEICSTHYGHEGELGRTWLPIGDREKFAAQLQAGIGKEEIMEKIRKDVGLEFHRSHILTKKDLENIERFVKVENKQGINSFQSITGS